MCVKCVTLPCSQKKMARFGVFPVFIHGHMSLILTSFNESNILFLAGQYRNMLHIIQNRAVGELIRIHIKVLNVNILQQSL